MEHNKNLEDARNHLHDMFLEFNARGIPICDTYKEAIVAGTTAMRAIEVIDEALHDGKLGSIGLQMTIQACVDEVKNL